MTKPMRIPRISENDPESVFGVEYVDVINMHDNLSDALAEWAAVRDATDEDAVLVFGWRYQSGDIQWKNEVST